MAHLNHVAHIIANRDVVLKVMLTLTKGADQTTKMHKLCVFVVGIWHKVKQVIT